MLGLAPISTVALSAASGGVHALAVSEGSAGLQQGSIAWRGAAYALEAAATHVLNIASRGNVLSVVEGTQAATYNAGVSGISAAVQEGLYGADSVVLGVSAMPLNVLETAATSIEPPLIRQQWEFILTGSGGRWVLVVTKD